MKLFSKFLAVLIAALAFSSIAHAASTAGDKTDITECGAANQDYLFALCAASTCENTGKRISVNTPAGGQRLFKEVKCTCPVVNTNSTSENLPGILSAALPSSRASIANVTGGNMRNTPPSCNYPSGEAVGATLTPREGQISDVGLTQVWSLYSTVTPFPQRDAIPGPSNPDPGWTTQKATWNYCSARLNQGREFTNCWSFKCGAPYLSHGVLVSDCYCPKGEDVLSALPTRSSKSFFTDAGGNASPAQQEAYCRAHPVGGF